MSLVVVVGGLKIVVEDLLALITVMGETVGCGSLLCGLLTFRSCCLGLSGNVSQVVGQCIIQVAVVVLVLAPQLSVMSLPFTALLLVLLWLFRLRRLSMLGRLASLTRMLHLLVMLERGLLWSLLLLLILREQIVVAIEVTRTLLASMHRSPLLAMSASSGHKDGLRLGLDVSLILDRFLLLRILIITKWIRLWRLFRVQTPVEQCEFATTLSNEFRFDPLLGLDFAKE